ncbi:MAG: DNA double-strand break repair nuclease NurA [Nitrososphaerales archaeon]
MLDPKLTQSVIRGKIGMLIRDANEYPDEVDKVAAAYSQFKDAFKVREILLQDDNLLEDYREVSLPLEDSQIIEPPMTVGGLKPSESRWTQEVLLENAIIGIDTSEMAPSTHRSPAFLLVNVGYSTIAYAEESKHFEGCRPYFNPYSEILEKYKEGESPVIPSWAGEVSRIDYEEDTLTELCKNAEIKPYILFDESFSASYLSARSRLHREKVVMRMKSFHSKLIDDQAKPIGVFYTSSSAFVSMIRKVLAADKDWSAVGGWRIRDSALFRKILPLGWRSPAFKLMNMVTEEFHLNIVGFYVKTGWDSVMRVEFPEQSLHRINDIHKVVVAQSALGGGYPYLMQRAHEQAYISARERQWVLDYLNRLLGEAGIRDAVKLSRKELRKILGVV